MKKSEGNIGCHLCELDIEKTTISIHPKVEIKHKVMQALAKEGESPAATIVRVLTEMVNDVKLTKTNLDAVRAEITANYEKRMAKRESTFGGRQRGAQKTGRGKHLSR